MLYSSLAGGLSTKLMAAQILLSLATVKCKRCEKEISKDKVAKVSFKNRETIFCENCFKAVFKYDESLRTVAQIYEQKDRRTPFTIRSNNWHRSSFMIVNEVKSAPSKGGGSKTVYVGDFYLRGVKKEEGHTVGKANHFIWTPWSAEEAAKYKENTPQEEQSVESSMPDGAGQ
jgi:hypothetical protein